MSVALKYKPPVLFATFFSNSSSISTLVIPNLNDPFGFKATGALAFPLVPKPIVYVFISKFAAKSAAVEGSINPELFTPSVNKIITLLFALLSFNLFTEVAKPIPIAVPSSIIPSKVMSERDLITTSLSDVTGVLV